MEKRIESYRDLEVWKNGIEIVNQAYRFSKQFPDDERFGLISQIQRAAVSIPANIAEGYARRYTKEFKKFCLIALGSCSELETLFVVALNQQYLNKAQIQNLERLMDSESKMLMSLVKKLS